MDSVIIFWAPYPFSTLRTSVKILSSFDNISLNCLSAYEGVIRDVRAVRAYNK